MNCLLSRRQLLACLGVGPLLWRWQTKHAGHPLPALSALFSSTASAIAVGNIFLALHPQERDRPRLTALTRMDLAASDRSAWCEWLRQRCRAEFGSEEVVQVDGWLMARSEARLCALMAMSA